MNNITNIFEIGFFDGLTWFPIVLAIGIIYKYLKTIDVSIDGITIISSIVFTSLFNYTNSLLLSFAATAFVAVISYGIVSFLSTELKINSILSGIIISLILHSVSVIYVGESMPLQYESIVFVNSHSASVIITVLLSLLTVIFFKTRFGIKLKVAADNPSVNIPDNPRVLSLMLYVVSGLILSVGAVQYTSKIGLARSGGGFEFLITALSSFLFTDRIIDFIIKGMNGKKNNYSYSKYFTFSIIQSPVFKALVGSILFQIAVLFIIYYTSNPAYWKLIFGIILLITVARPSFQKFIVDKKTIDGHKGISLQNLSFQYDNGYEKRKVFSKIDFHFTPGLNIIWGSNGVGKTSLLKLLSGDLIPDSGSIIKDGKNITSMKRNERKVFFIKQVPYDSLSINSAVFENAVSVSNKFSLSSFKMENSGESQISNSDFQIQFGKQNQFWVQSVGSLSGGQAQKLNLFLCSISDADTILADEPTSGIDSENLQVFERFINKISESEKNIIIVTHDERLKGILANHYELKNNSLTKTNQYE